MPKGASTMGPSQLVNSHDRVAPAAVPAHRHRCEPGVRYQPGAEIYRYSNGVV
jgi:hypothetical protein